MATISHGLADSTQQQRAALWDRLTRWLNSQQLPMNGENASAFVIATGVSPQAQLAYAKTLATMLEATGHRTIIPRMLIKALQRQGAEIPLHQALPLTREQLLHAARSLPRVEQAILLLAWKTASRIGEAVELRPDNLLELSTERIIVRWGTLPKSQKTNPFTATNYAVIVGSLTAEIATTLQTSRTGPRERYTTWTAPQMAAHITKTFGRGYSGHSVKRGALTHLLTTNTPLNIIQLLAKHKLVTQLSSTTIRYLAHETELALRLGTQDATIWL